jgi:class 3 adenylate cyclase
MKNTRAARVSLKINHCVRNIINPAAKAQYSEADFVLQQTVGIDTSKLLVARTGVRGANDLVWVGRAANYAAKSLQRYLRMKSYSFRQEIVSCGHLS